MTIASDLAPILLFCYNRPLHLEKTLESLQQNTLATGSDLIIYSDGPKHEKDKPLVEQVRQILRQISGFKTVVIHESPGNNGLANSVVQGVSDTIYRYKKVIVLEDDLILSSDFLSFMNQALKIYQGRNDIFSVTGYCPPLSLPSRYSADLFMAPRASSWGWGTWLNRWEKADWKMSDFSNFKKDKKAINRFIQGGDDLWPMLIKQQSGVIDSWAIRWTYAQFKNEAYGLYPVKSKLKNIGTDGSGTNFSYKTDYYDSEINPEPIGIDPFLLPDPSVIKAFKKYYQVPLLLKIKNFIKYRIL
ncbi:glycosyltransferase [Dyadobacter tibetensis]|uniref:glycosyltransferase n=1 Tax=Dyadobacter tibetensis TaxID=1211851 RepID=UPI0004B0E40F|nr:glycosyltransferase [Dyadobacter tibetensis]